MRLLLIGLTAVAFGLAAPVKDSNYERLVQPFLNEYCVQCHGPKVAMADRRFDTLGADLASVETQHRWKAIVDRLNLGAMPPAGAKQPSDERRREVIEMMTARLTMAMAETKSTGARTVLRRLNRYEYGRTVRHLLSLEGMLADPTMVFPPDGVDQGFTNIGSALSTSDFLLAGYLSAAETFIDRAAAVRRAVSTLFRRHSIPPAIAMTARTFRESISTSAKTHPREALL
jgi:hypothetical protein